MCSGYGHSAIGLIYGFGLATIALTITAIRFTTAHLRNRQERKKERKEGIMKNKRSLLTLVLESYKSSCRMLAEPKKNGNDVYAALTSQLIETSHSMQVSMFRNILMSAELTAEQLVEVEKALKDTETEHFHNKEILDSVLMIRAELHTLQS